MALFVSQFNNITPLGVGNWTSSDCISDNAALLGVLISSDNNLTLNFNWSNDGVTTILTTSEVILAGVTSSLYQSIKAQYVNLELVNTGTNNVLIVQGFFMV